VTSQSIAVSVWAVNANTQLAVVFFVFQSLETPVSSNNLVYLQPLSHHCVVFFIQKWREGQFPVDRWRCSYDALTFIISLELDWIKPPVV